MSARLRTTAPAIPPHGVSEDRRELRRALCQPSQGTDIAAAATTTLATSTGEVVQVTGSTGISQLRRRAGRQRHAPRGRVHRRAALTHNATSLILPGGANVQLVAGAVAHILGTPGTSNWRVANLVQGGSSTGPLLALAATQAAAQSALGLTAMLGAASGIATLDGSSVLPVAQLPATVSAIDLPANAVSVRNAGDTAWESRTQKAAFGGSVSAASGQFLPATGSFYVHAPDYAATLTHVRMTAVGGTCCAQVFESGAAINGFASPVAVTATPTNTTSTEAVAAGALMRVDWTAGTGTLSALVVTCHGLRTAS